MQFLNDDTIQAHLLPLLPRRALGSLARCSNRLRALVHGKVQHLSLGGDDVDAVVQHRCHERFSAVTRVEYTLSSTVALSRFLVMSASHMAHLRSFRLTMPQGHPAVERPPEYLYTLAAALPSLQHLEVCLPLYALNGEAVEALAAVSGLESLNLEDSQLQLQREPRMADRVQAPQVALTKLTALKRLYAPMLPLATLPALPSLNALHCGKAYDEDCEALAAKFPQLQGLTLLDSVEWESRSLASALCGLSALERLELPCSGLRWQDREQVVRHCSGLTSLHLDTLYEPQGRNDEEDEEDAAAYGRCTALRLPSLRRLVLADVYKGWADPLPAPQSVIVPLHIFPFLTGLTVGYIEAPADALLTHIVQASCSSNLQVLVLQAGPKYEPGVQSVWHYAAQLPQLRVLHLEVPVDEAWRTWFAGACTGLSRLTELKLRQQPRRVMEEAAEQQGEVALQVAKRQLCDADLGHLVQLRGLRRLELVQLERITTGAVVALVMALPRLGALVVSGCPGVDLAAVPAAYRLGWEVRGVEVTATNAVVPLFPSALD